MIGWLTRFARPAAGHEARRRLAQGTVEFALLSLVFIPMAVGAIEIARGVWYYNQVSQLAREGARYAIVTGTELRTDYNEIGNSENGGAWYQLDNCGCLGTTTVGWMARRDVGLQRDRTRVRINYDPDLSGNEDYVRGAKVSVEVTYRFEPILAQYLGIPAVINMQSMSTMYMQ